MVDYYGTLGPACREKEKLEGMLDAGMTGIRINLSHGGLSYAKESLAELEQLVDRITEKVNRLKISLSEVTQTAVEGPTE